MQVIFYTYVHNDKARRKFATCLQVHIEVTFLSFLSSPSELEIFSASPDKDTLI